MAEGKFRVWLSPVHGGSYTQVLLSGVLPSVLPIKELRKLVDRLSLFSGYPVECVLSVAKEEAGWCEFWTNTLGSIPAQVLEVRYQVKALRPNGPERRR